ncbi:MAG TPA: glycosyltransferase family 4 protein [Alloacidobacterium sp.]|nr:glycosyltransferase family 4 protein [Alloacidobacterium sp.]
MFTGSASVVISRSESNLAKYRQKSPKVAPGTMRIVFYNHTGIVSGAEKMLLLSLGNLPRNIFDVKLVCPQEGSLQDSANSLGVPTYTCHPIRARFTYNPFLFFGYLLSIARAMIGLRKTLRSLSPDILQANTVRAGIVATISTLGTRIPIIWHTHDILPSHPLTTLTRLLAHSSKRIRIVACSRAAAQTLRPFTAKGIPVTVIHNGIDVARFRHSPEARATKREEMGVRKESFVVGIVGQVTPRKGQLGLIRAFTELHSAVPEAILVIVGAPLFNKDHDYLGTLEREVSALQIEKSVRFLGQRSDVAALMQALDLFVLNSDVEPFALVLIEAMTSGIASIATDCGGPTEIIHHGVDGEIVTVGDHHALVRAMTRLATSPSLRAKYGNAASRNVTQRFSKSQYVAEWCRLYSEINTSALPLSNVVSIANESLDMQAGIAE